MTNETSSKPSGRLATLATRCQATWNPGVWPYIRRCRETALWEVTDGNDVTFLCAEHMAATNLEAAKHRSYDEAVSNP